MNARLARDDELDAVGELTLAAYAELEPRMPQLWEAYSKELLDARARAAHGSVYVIEDDTGLVGAAALLPSDDPDEVVLRFVATHPSARRRGVGRKVMDAAFGLAREGGAKRLRWHTVSIFENA